MFMCRVERSIAKRPRMGPHASSVGWIRHGPASAEYDRITYAVAFHTARHGGHREQVPGTDAEYQAVPAIVQQSVPAAVAWHQRRAYSVWWTSWARRLNASVHGPERHVAEFSDA